MSDYARFDHPAISSFLFYPRPEESRSLAGSNIDELSIPVDKDVVIGGKIFTASKNSPSILFFHGNGEIVIDYDDLGPLYVDLGLNFIPVDYRGYGRSGGSPSVSSMMKDCHVIFDYIIQWLEKGNYSGPFIIMGRSLGSASALELAAARQDDVDGLIIDSGFAYALPLLRIIGVDPDRLGIREEEGFRNIDKIRQFRKPTLIIHAERDHIIPYSDGSALFEASPAEIKDLVTIKEANHNTIFMYGLKEYLAAVRKLADSLA
ncbi:MAG TPA: alpha/beta hydrolase [Spirochaetota bacterium]|nr:alpha/beta hydrolase [Spirochaetota bacterium]HPV41711.1 alpha/beta hydrolase [Spirochaetota bacterium]